MPAFALESTQHDAVNETVLQTDDVRGRSIRAVDLLPGTPSIVRRAEVVIKHGDSEQTIGLWVPGNSPQLIEAGAAY